MNINEMSNEFDILYNQVNSNQAASIDEYEKSVFLTKAQDEIVKAYFDPRGNKFLEGFDDGQKRQYDFSALVRNIELEHIEDYTQIEQYDPRSYVYIMPDDFLLTLNERLYEKCCSVKYQYQVNPISYAVYSMLMKKPYQYPPKREAWRLITGQASIQTNDSGNNSNSQTNEQENTSLNRGSSTINRTYCEIIGRFKNNNKAPEYKMRYVMKPTPIILVNLKNQYEGLSIDGKYGDIESDGNIAVDDPNTGSGIPCYLPEGIHHEIVQRAVELATAVYNPQALGNIAGVGNVSATNLGVVPRQENK